MELFVKQESRAGCKRVVLKLMKKIIPFVIHDNKSRKIFYRNHENSLHPQFREFNCFHLRNALFSQAGG